MPVVKVCEVCNKEFLVPPVRAASAKFCSAGCKGVHTAQQYSAARAKMVCGFCGKEFSVPQSRAGRGNGKFCSNQCRNSSQIGKPVRVGTEGSTVHGSGGYLAVRLSKHPFASSGYVREHRVIMEVHMALSAPDHPFLIEVDGQKYLRPGIEVHHRNEDVHDNRIENLVACTPAGHRDLHKGRVPMHGETWPEPEVMVEAEDRYVTVTCQKCGSDFDVKRSTWKSRGAKYCSNACASGYEGDLPSKLECACKFCGKKFLAKRHKVLAGLAKFCSNACRYEARRGHPPDHKF